MNVNCEIKAVKEDNTDLMFLSFFSVIFSSSSSSSCLLVNTTSLRALTGLRFVQCAKRV